MIQLSPEIEQQIVNFGEVAEVPEKIAEALKMDIETFVKEFNDASTAIYRAYQQGFQQGKYRIKLLCMKEANNGKVFEYLRMKKREEEDEKLREIYGF